MNFLRRQPQSTLPMLPLFSQFNEEMNRFFDRDFGLLGERWNTLGEQWQPSIDIEQKDKEFVVRADIPGVDPKDIKVSLENEMLTIEGSRKSKYEENRENFRCVECNFGSFYRSVRLPDAVDDKKIKAHSHNGVLEVTIPKSKTSMLKTIPVLAD